jgi:3-dehydroquinate dehydratase-2
VTEILVINGPNLNLLGTREPEIYGRTTLDEINARLSKQAQDADVKIDFFQSNAEHALIDRIQQAMKDKTAFLLLNPGAYTHTSIALRDALAGAKIPFIEVHLSNVHAREPFRRHSYLSDLAVGVIVGLGPKGYELALAAAIERINTAVRTK